MADKIRIHCDAVHPESEEIIAEGEDILPLSDPEAKCILAIAKAFPDVYTIYTSEDGQILIARAQ